MNKQSPVLPTVATPVYAGAESYSFDQPGSDDVGTRLRATWSLIFRNRILIASIVAATMVLGLVATLLMTSRYSAVATVQIEQQSSKVLDDTDTQPVEAVQDADRFLQTQVDILNSRALAIRVMQTLHLDANDKFVTAMGFTPLDEAVGELSLQDSKRDQLLRILQGSLSVSLPRNSRIVQINFLSPDPKLSALVANSFADNFIQSNLRRRFDTSLYARTFLSEQLAAAKQRLELSERAMISYARTARLIDASAGMAAGTTTDVPAPRSLTTSNLVQINSAYAQATALRVQAQQRWDQARSKPLMSLPEVLSNPAVLALTEVRAQAQAEYQEQLLHRQASFPVMQQQAARIAELNGQINKIASNIRDTIRGNYLIAAKQESALSGNVDQLKSDTLSEQDRSVQYNILRREADTNRTMYDGLLQRFKEVSAAAGLTANNISQIDYAEAPAKTVSPRPLVNLAASGMLGLLIAGLFVFGREKFDDAVRSPEDVQRKLGLPFLNATPLLKNNMTPDEALADPRSGFSESYAALRTSLELVTSEGLPRILLVTSSRQSEGKSTSAHAIARDFAKIGRRVLLIDADLRKPSLHRTLGVDNKAGFSSILARHRSFEEVVKETETPNLSFVASGPLPPNPAELLSGSMLPAVLADLAERFDLVVIDGPPVLGLADAILLGTNAEGTVFIIEADGSHHGNAKAAIRRLQAANIPIIGALLTKYDARKGGYGEYGYAYSYSYSYGVDAKSKKKQAA
jgi:succinoglycan biosynthesis transport protein ExoP